MQIFYKLPTCKINLKFQITFPQKLFILGVTALPRQPLLEKCGTQDSLKGWLLVQVRGGRSQLSRRTTGGLYSSSGEEALCTGGSVMSLVDAAETQIKC